jgi:histidinol-phosphatase (PHP family)
MKRFNLHTHSNFSDGALAPEEYVTEAIRLKYIALGFSSHAPVTFINKYALKEQRSQEYRQTIRNLQQKYADRIEIYLGLEIDYIPGVTRDFDLVRKDMGLDFAIGAIHFIKGEDGNHGIWFIDGASSETYDKGLKEIFHDDIRKGVKAYYHALSSMITTQKPDIIAHMDKIKMHNGGRFFREDEPWYVALVDEALDVIARSGSIVEINSRGVYKKRCPDPFPSLAILKKLKQLKVPITLSSDAHAPEELNPGMDIVIASALEAGYKETCCLINGIWQTVEIN